MVAKQKETAEQKLLKMIEASSGEGAVTTKTHQKVVKKQDALTLVRTSNKLLILGVITMGCLLAYEVQNGMALMSKTIDFSSLQVKSSRAGSVEKVIPTIQNLSFYLAGVNRRNFFKPYEAKAPSMIAVTDTNDLLIDRISGLRLVGISWLDHVDTASAMIEDKDKQVTYFLQKGEKLGDVVVKTIYADSVELRYKHEEILIRYDKPQN